MAGALTHLGPARSLARALRRRPSLAMACASYMAAQLMRLQWPIPDLITWVPSPRLRLLLGSQDHAALLAKSLARLLSCKAMSALRCRGHRPPQARLPLEVRRQLAADYFVLHRPDLVLGQKVLVVDDLIVSGATMRACLKSLTTGSPLTAYGLALCQK